MTNKTVKKLAALAAGVASGLLSLRLFTILGVTIGGPGGDSGASSFLVGLLVDHSGLRRHRIYWRERTLAGRRLGQIEAEAELWSAAPRRLRPRAQGNLRLVDLV